MKRPVLLIALMVLVVILAEPRASVISRISVPLTASGTSDNEITSTVEKTGNSWACATITITMRPILGDQAS